MRETASLLGGYFAKRIKQVKNTNQNLKKCVLGHWTSAVFLMCVIVLLGACGSTPKDGEGKQAITDENGGSAVKSAPTEPVTAVGDVTAVPVIAEPLRVVESCKKEPYVKYEKEARESIKQGWEATKAERYGVGFRDRAEYKKWGNTHNAIFKRVSTECSNVTKCAKKHKKDKGRRCAAVAKTYDKWQKTAKTFAAKVKSVRSSQPPKLCSIKPSADDQSRCYVALADKIDKVCKSDECSEASECWRGVSFLDDVIRQAEQSCRFVHRKLSECRSYTEAVARRKLNFAQCSGLRKNLNLDLPPVL